MTSLTPASSPSSPALLMDDGVDAVSNVIVHPMVLLHVLDHHNRRQEAAGRVIGTLLGRRDGRTVSKQPMFWVDTSLFTCRVFFSHLVLFGIYILLVRSK